MRLKEKLTATYAIHSKIYPRYKTYKAFHLATANLSNWLSAHEDANTDIVLVGHSMGGLLAEEVVLLVGLTESYCYFRAADCQSSGMETVSVGNIRYSGSFIWMLLYSVRGIVSSWLVY